jgi:hypothetical protein
VDPQPRGTQLRLRCSVVGLLRALLAPRLSGSRGSAPCAFHALSPTRFGLLVAAKPHTSGGFGALRVPGGKAGPFPGFDYKSIWLLGSRGSEFVYIPTQDRRVRSPEYLPPSTGALAKTRPPEDSAA